MKKLFFNLLNAVETGIILIDPEERVIVEANPKAAEILEISLDKLINESCQKYLCTEKEGSCHAFENKNYSLENIEIYFKTDFVKKVILKSVKPVVLEGKKYLLESFMDITDQKQDQLLLHYYAKELKGLYLLTELSSSVESIDELIKKGISEIVPTILNIEKQSLVLEIDDHKYTTSEKEYPIQFSKDILVENLKRGSISYCSNHPLPKKYLDLTVLGTYAKIIGQTIQRLDRQKEKKKYQELFEAVFNNAPIGVFIREDQKIIKVNNYFKNMLGYGSNESLEIPVSSLLEEDYFLKGNQTLIKKKDGTDFPVELTETKLYDGIYLVRFKDISLRKKIEEQRIETEKLKAVLETSGAACHELSQPLTVLRGNIDLEIMKGNKSNYLNLLIKQVNKMDLILQKISRINSYHRKKYVAGSYILDIDKSSE